MRLTLCLLGTFLLTATAACSTPEPIPATPDPGSTMEAPEAPEAPAPMPESAPAATSCSDESPCPQLECECGPGCNATSDRADCVEGVCKPNDGPQSCEDLCPTIDCHEDDTE